jgi:hypothetical protein
MNQDDDKALLDAHATEQQRRTSLKPTMRAVLDKRAYVVVDIEEGLTFLVKPVGPRSNDSHFECAGRTSNALSKAAEEMLRQAGLDWR